MRYVKVLSGKVIRVLALFSDTKFAYRAHNCLNNVFSKLKDFLEKRNNVMYKIPCRDNGELSSQFVIKVIWVEQHKIINYCLYSVY